MGPRKRSRPNPEGDEPPQANRAQEAKASTASSTIGGQDTPAETQNVTEVSDVTDSVSIDMHNFLSHG